MIPASIFARGISIVAQIVSNSSIILDSRSSNLRTLFVFLFFSFFFIFYNTSFRRRKEGEIVYKILIGVYKNYGEYGHLSGRELRYFQTTAYKAAPSTRNVNIQFLRRAVRTRPHGRPFDSTRFEHDPLYNIFYDVGRRTYVHVYARSSSS